MSYKVEITQDGRCGQDIYVEDGKRLPFDWEFSAAGVTIYVPTPQEWDAYCEKYDAVWAKGRRREILERVAQEVRRQKVKSARFEILDHWVELSFEDHWIFSLFSKIVH
jgi:hypothetical protein